MKIVRITVAILAFTVFAIGFPLLQTKIQNLLFCSSATHCQLWSPILPPIALNIVLVAILIMVFMPSRKKDLKIFSLIGKIFFIPVLIIYIWLISSFFLTYTILTDSQLIYRETVLGFPGDYYEENLNNLKGIYREYSAYVSTRRGSSDECWVAEYIVTKDGRRFPISWGSDRLTGYLMEELKLPVETFMPDDERTRSVCISHPF